MEIIKLDDRVGLRDLKWTSDGKYIVYTTNNNRYAAPINGGPHVIIFEEYACKRLVFEWASSALYAVEPDDKLPLVWGFLKTLQK